MGDQWRLNALIMSSSTCPLFMSEMKGRELLCFGSSVSPQDAPIQGNALTGCLSWLLPSFTSTQKIPVILVSESFSPSKGKSNSMTELGRLSKQLHLNKEGQKGKRKLLCKSMFLYLCFALWLQWIQISFWAWPGKNSLYVMCPIKGSAKPSIALKVQHFK